MADVGWYAMGKTASNAASWETASYSVQITRISAHSGALGADVILSAAYLTACKFAVWGTATSSVRLTRRYASSGAVQTTGTSAS